MKELRTAEELDNLLAEQGKTLTVVKIGAAW